MAMTVVATRNVPERARGFLASCMLEIAPGVYTAPRMNEAVRERVWSVMLVYCGAGEDFSVVMTWPDGSAPCGQAVRVLGAPPVELVDVHGLVLARRDLTADDRRSLTTRVSTEGHRRDERATSGPPDETG